jgi:hypothetical protein
LYAVAASGTGDRVMTASANTATSSILKAKEMKNSVEISNITVPYDTNYNRKLTIRGDTTITGKLEAPLGYLKGTIIQTKQFIDTQSRSTASNTPVVGYITPVISIKKNSHLYLFVDIPFRNDGTGWGGVYHLIDFRVNVDVGTVPANTWVLLGNSGYYMTYYQIY